MLRRITQPHVIAAHRIIIGVAERMPDVGREFFEAGPLRLVRAMATFLDAHVASGTLKIEDSVLAAGQFLELAQTMIFRPRLYAAATRPSLRRGNRDEPSASAVRLFLAGYRA